MVLQGDDIIAVSKHLHYLSKVRQVLPESRLNAPLLAAAGMKSDNIRNLDFHFVQIKSRILCGEDAPQPRTRAEHGSGPVPHRNKVSGAGLAAGNFTVKTIL